MQTVTSSGDYSSCLYFQMIKQLREAELIYHVCWKSVGQEDTWVGGSGKVNYWLWEMKLPAENKRIECEKRTWKAWRWGKLRCSCGTFQIRGENPKYTQNLDIKFGMKAFNFCFVVHVVSCSFSLTSDFLLYFFHSFHKYSRNDVHILPVFFFF